MLVIKWAYPYANMEAHLNVSKVLYEPFNLRRVLANFIHILLEVLFYFKAAQSVTFDLLVLEIKLLFFFKNTVKILKSRLIYYHFLKF